MTALRGRAPLVRRHAMTRTIQSQTLRRLGLLVRSEEHTSELQSQSNLVCRLLLEKKKKQVKHAWRRQRIATINARRRQRAQLDPCGLLVARRPLASASDRLRLTLSARARDAHLL